MNIKRYNKIPFYDVLITNSLFVLMGISTIFFDPFISFFEKFGFISKISGYIIILTILGIPIFIWIFNCKKIPEPLSTGRFFVFFTTPILIFILFSSLEDIIPNFWILGLFIWGMIWFYYYTIMYLLKKFPIIGMISLIFIFLGYQIFIVGIKLFYMIKEIFNL